ncbi:MAG: transporter substrate-binding protein [Segetibacter sp.]|nr:transporter substrate-binding protein [Segetibacter sp.]
MYQTNAAFPRLISLVPSQTELLYDLGLTDEVVGITKFCIHPNGWFRTKTRIGGTKTVDIEKVRSLNSTLILANKEENVKEQVEALQTMAPVYVSDIATLEEAIQMIEQVGKLVNKEDKAKEIVAQIEQGFKKLENLNNKYSPSNSSTLQYFNPSILQSPNTAYLIWREPYMTVGDDTFIHNMLQRCGFNNIFSDQRRYPEITIDQIAASNCELLLLSSEPYPFKEKHLLELQAQLPGTKILLVDGEMFSWYGSRLIKAPAYFIELLDRIKA